MKSKTKKILLFIIPFLLLLFLFLGVYVYFNHNPFKTIFESGKSVSEKQISFQEDLDRDLDYGEEFTEIRGYSEQVINQKYPNIILSNLSGNTVYLEYQVTLNGKEIYHTDLIEPGMMELFNVYKVLPKGEHLLIYNISTYDIKTKQLQMSGIHLQQKINIQ